MFDNFESPHNDPDRAAAALPHTADGAMERHPIYFNRLSRTSQNAVWRRWLMLEGAWAESGSIEIDSPDRLGDSERLLPGERGYRAPRSDLETPAVRDNRTSTQTDAERTVDSHRTLVAPCYIVALDYDDFMQAVEKVERDWNVFFAERTTFLREFDMYELIETSRGKILIPNQKYKLPTEVVPPRLKGRWSTYDGPPELQDFESGSWYVSDDMKLSVRPAERLRSSWMRHKKQFGDRKQSDGSDPREAFQRQVDEWREAHARYEADLKIWDDLSATNAELEKHNESLRFHSLRLVLNLGRLSQAPNPETLFEQDRSNAFKSSIPSNSGLLEQWFLRLPVVIFLMDTVDHADQVKFEVEWYTSIHAQLQAPSDLLKRVKDATAAPSNGLPFVEDLLELDYTWPSTPEIESMMRFAARNATNMLKALNSESLRTEAAHTLWSHVVEVATLLLDKNDPSDTPDPQMSVKVRTPNSSSTTLRS